MNHRVWLLTFAAAALAGCTIEDGKVQTSPTLEKLLPPTPQQSTRQAFNVSNADDRRVGILELSKNDWGRKGKYVEAYALLAKDEDASVRSAAIVSLGRCNDPKYLPNVVAALSDENEFVRMDAADVLDVMNGDEAIEPLRLHAMRDPKMDVRTRCLKALRYYRQANVYETLLMAMDDPEFGIRLAAQTSLRAMTGENCGPGRLQWQRRLKERGDLDLAATQQADLP